MVDSSAVHLPPARAHTARAHTARAHTARAHTGAQTHMQTWQTCRQVTARSRSCHGRTKGPVRYVGGGDEAYNGDGSVDQGRSRYNLENGLRVVGQPHVVL